VKASLCTKQRTIKQETTRRKRPVALVFPRVQNGSTHAIKALIDGGLSRLIASEIASDAASSSRSLKSELSGMKDRP